MSTMKHLQIIFCISFFSPVFALNSRLDLDTFQILKFYPTKTETRQWNSLHWSNGIERTIRYERDQYDPTDWTEDHSSGTNGFFIDGKGVMYMSGSGPRFHINSLNDSKTVNQFFKDVEFTAYYRRKGNTGADYGGMVVGVRSGPLGHGSPGGNDCDATTYYARFRHDGKWDFEKELKHPNSDYWSSNGFHTQTPLWGGKPLPENRWIGMKYIVYDIDNGLKVKLELYIDSTSNGEPVNGGDWKLVGEIVDEGNWPAASESISGCDYSDPKTIITPGNGTILMRTDGDGAEYKKVSIREINTIPNVILGGHDSNHQKKALNLPATQSCYNLLGQKLNQSIIYISGQITITKQNNFILPVLLNGN